MKTFFHMVGEDTTLDTIRDEHIIPVYTRDNTPLISEAAFVERTLDIVENHFNSRPTPTIRVSHPIKGRTYEARNKKVSELLPHEQTLYYERMGFAVEIPGYDTSIDGKRTELMMCGVKAYNLDTMHRAGSVQHFKIAIGRSIKVCLNMAIAAKYGGVAQIVISEEDHLSAEIEKLVVNYDETMHLSSLKHLTELSLTEHQFATLIGKLRMLDGMGGRKDLPKILITDGQFKQVASLYTSDSNFRGNGKISLWNFHNLLTEAVKNSYLDSFIDRQNNAYELCDGLSEAQNENSPYHWFLN